MLVRAASRGAPAARAAATSYSGATHAAASRCAGEPVIFGCRPVTDLLLTCQVLTALGHRGDDVELVYAAAVHQRASGSDGSERRRALGGEPVRRRARLGCRLYTADCLTVYL